MNESESSKERQRKIAENLGREIAAQEARKKKARQEKDRGIWFGLGMFGLIGWSVAVPTLIGVALGIWIDTSWSSRFSWTLMLLFLGVILGCLNAWYWVKRQSRYD